MKKLVFFSLFFLTFLGHATFAQKTENTEEEIFTVVEQPPIFPGGMQALGKYLSDNLKYPKKAARKNKQGTVYVNFVVNRVGEIVDIKVLKGIGFGLDEEAMRVVKNMPTWVPGTQGGKTVSVRYNLPIKFLLN
jgi:protein TonB